MTPNKPASKPTDISRDLSLLHPVFREAVKEVVSELDRIGIPMRVFEAYRSPARQSYLYAQGRTRPGVKVTAARAGESFHQYGLAADFALFIDGKWTWTESRELLGAFDSLRDIGELYGLTQLTSERAHLQLSGVELSELQAGLLPGGGDGSWWDNLTESNRTHLTKGIGS